MPAKKSLTKTRTSTTKTTKAAEKAAEHEGVATHAHKLATVPPESFHTTYVSRDLSGVSEFDIFDYAHKNHINVLIEGPTGPGKTSAVMAYAAKNDLPFYAVPSNVGVEPSQLFGKFIPDGQGGFVWQDGPVTDLVRHGGVLLINEVNFLPPRVATVLFGLLDKRRQIALLDHKAEVIDAHDNLLIVADMNPDYAGTQALNKAFRNRFAIQLDWDYDKNVESALVKSENLLDFAKKVREQFQQGAISTPTSTNMLMEFEKIAEFNYEFAVSNLLNHFVADERPAASVAFTAFTDDIKADLFGHPDLIVFTDVDGKDWTQNELDELRAKNIDNPNYIDPQLGRYGVDFLWEGEDDNDDDEDETF